MEEPLNMRAPIPTLIRTNKSFTLVIAFRWLERPLFPTEIFHNKPYTSSTVCEDVIQFSVVQGNLLHSP